MWSHRIFDQIIEGEDDLIGMVAYSIYKQEKIKWIKRHKEKTGKYPEKEAIDQYFHDFASTDHVLKRYRNQAEEVVNRTFQLSQLEALEEYKKQVRDEQIITSIEGKLYKTKVQSVVENAIAALIASGIIALLSLCIYLYSEMLKDQQTSLADSVPAVITKQLPKSLAPSSQ